MKAIDILLVQTPNVLGTFFNLPGKEIPLSLCQLGAYLDSVGYRCRVLDLDFQGRISPDLEDALALFRPRVMGISAYSPNIAIAGRIAKRAKAAAPGLPVVIGGFHASALPEQTLREFPDFDYLVFGEGEQTLAELLAYLSAGGTEPEGMAGVAYGREESIRLGPARPLIQDLDGLPFPDRSLVPVTRYRPDPGNYFQLPSTGILFSRGCPFQCTFCSKSVFGNRIRYRGEKNFLAEIRQCIDRFGIRDYRFEDEAPTINMKKIDSLVEAIVDEGLSITWNCFSRVDGVDEPILRKMKKAGCYHVTYGIESSLPETLERICKKIDLEKAAETVAMTKKLGIECKANFILGFPWETATDMRSVVSYAKTLSPDLVTFNLFKPLPGSILYHELIESGRLRHTSWEDYFTTSEGLLFDARYSEAEARQILRWAVFSFYLRPGYIVQKIRSILRHPGREMQMIGRGLWILGRELLHIFRGKQRTSGRFPERTKSGSI